VNAGNKSPSSRPSSSELPTVSDAIDLLPLHDHVLRWGQKKEIKDFGSLFSVEGLHILCQFKISQTGFCKKKFKAQSRDGKWAISNFTSHFTENHMKKNPSSASPSIPSLLASNNFPSEQTIQNKRGHSISQHQSGKFEV